MDAATATPTRRLYLIETERWRAVRGSSHSAADMCAALAAYLDAEIARMRAEALADYGHKLYLYDDAGPIVRLVKQVYEGDGWAQDVDSLPSTPEPRSGAAVGVLGVLCTLARALYGVDPEGRAYDFCGDAVLVELDRAAERLLDCCTEPGKEHDTTLQNVARLFSNDNAALVELQTYCLFEGIGDLRSGPRAARMLAATTPSTRTLG